MSATPVRIAIAGASGRMGQELIAAILNNPSTKLTGAFDRAGSPSIGLDAGATLGKHTGVAITDQVQDALAQADVFIDFTRPEGTLEHLAAAQSLGVKAVIGTTGFTDEQKAQLTEFSTHNAIVFSPNMSVGVNVTFKLLELAAKALATGYDIEIIEAHHRHKVDAPSGTALKMGEVIADTLGRNLNDVAVYERFGYTGERKPDSIGFSTIRGGDIVGDHTVLFAGTGERIEISHKSSSRAGYAQGSLRAALFLQAQSKGMFDMFDVLSLRD